MTDMLALIWVFTEKQKSLGNHRSYIEEGQKISNLGQVNITGGKKESLWKENKCCKKFKFMLGICYRPPDQIYHKREEMASKAKGFVFKEKQYWCEILIILM